MQKSKLAILLKSLTAEEFKWLHKFVKSPFYNTNKHIIRMYELLRRYHPDFDHSKLTEETFFTKLFPGEIYDIQRLRLLMHRFSLLIEDYLAALHLRKNTFQAKKLLSTELGARNSFKLFKKKTEELLGELEASPIRDQSFYYNRATLNMQYYAHPATNRHEKGMDQLEKAMESLDIFFVLSKLKLACALKARETTLSEHFEFNLLNIILKNSNSDNLLVDIYTKTWALQKSNDDVESFNPLRTLFISNLDKIGQEDKRNILQVLLNFCTRMVNKGELDFIPSSLELYKIGLEHHCILIGKELSQTTFNNIVSVGLANKQFEWTKSFILTYKKHLDEEIRADAVTFSQALWHFYQKEFNKTIKLLLTHPFKKTHQVVGTKSLLIRTYIELLCSDDSYYDLSIAQINTFERYIRKNKTLTKSVSEAYLNFARFTKKLAGNIYQKKDMDAFEAKLKLSENLILKNWLLDKVKDQKQKRPR